MKLFSKRNKGAYRELEYHQRRWTSSRLSPRPFNIISDDLRNRISAEIYFITSRDDFLEFFILFENQKEEKIFLDSTKVDGFSLAELGYRMSDFFEFDNFYIKEVKYPKNTIRSRDENGRIIEKVDIEGTYFDDPKIFDLVEFLILFSQKSKRSEISKRFNDILSEEDSEFEIINGMIKKKEGDSIYALKNLMKDENLKQKIEDFDYYKDKDDAKNTSKISTEILNIIFSDFIEKNKKKEIDQMIKEAVDELVLSQGDVENKKVRLTRYFNDALLNLKSFNNDIYDIRHTEKSTIKTKGSCIYKFLSENNIAFADLILSVLKNKFIFTEDWEKIKNEYINKYQIDKNTRYIIKKPEDDDIKIDDVPF